MDLTYNKNLIPQSKNTSHSPINNSKNFFNIYDKSRRLSAAVFVVSNVISDFETIKSQIKNLSLKLVNLSVSLKFSNESDAKKILANIEEVSLELMSLLDIASISGLISEMNAEILRDEFKSFVNSISVFSGEIMNNNTELVKNTFSPKSPDFDTLENKKESVSTSPIDRSDNLMGVVNIEKKKKRKDIRKETILNFIKGHKNSSIKDILPNVSGCSEKTIQRELISLITEHKIIKTGERRWSKYSAL